MNENTGKIVLSEESSLVSYYSSLTTDGMLHDDTSCVENENVPVGKKKLHFTTTTFTSGGATGADFAWARAILRNRLAIDIMTFSGHSRTVPQGANVIEIPETQLKEANPKLAKAAHVLKRALPKPGYIEKLLQRNWFIVKDVDAVFAVGKRLIGRNAGVGVEGGTAWGCQMYYERCLEEKTSPMLWLFDLDEEQWLKCTTDGDWKVSEEQPSPIGFRKVALIGSRDVGVIGEAAINRCAFV